LLVKRLTGIAARNSALGICFGIVCLSHSLLKATEISATENEILSKYFDDVPDKIDNNDKLKLWILLCLSLFKSLECDQGP